MENTKYLVTSDLMDKYKVTRGTINNWRNEGMPFIKLGRMVRFNPEEVEKWLKDNKG